MTVPIGYEEVPCNTCGSSEVVVIYPAVDRAGTDFETEFRSSGDHPLTDRLVQCVKCGLQYVSPRLDPATILDGYTGGSDEVFVSQAAAREATFSRALRRIERHAPRRGRLLDVGTAGGSFIHVASQRGWDVAGCEPNVWLCEWGRRTYGLDIRPGTIFAQSYPDRTFDTVTVWDVLEHVPDPMAFLMECRRVLKPGGLLVVNYPDIGSVAAKAMGRKWVMLLSVHLYFYTRQTLADAANRAGYEIVEIRPHVQWLEWAYVLKRAQPVAGRLATALAWMSRRVGLSKVQVPYWIGQTLVVARARGESTPAATVR